jgi:Cu/Ag efflux pump CusA
MIDAIIRWSLDNRLFVLVGAAALLAWGVMQAREMPVDVFPDLTAPTVTSSPRPTAWRPRRSSAS